MGHDVVNVATDSAILLPLLEAAASGDGAAVSRIVNRGRRSSFRRIMAIAMRLVDRRPDLARKIVEKHWSIIPDWWRERWLERTGG